MPADVKVPTRAKRPGTADEESAYLIANGWDYDDAGSINDPMVRWYAPGEDRKEKKEWVNLTYKQEVRDKDGKITGYKDMALMTKDEFGNPVQARQILITVPGIPRGLAVKKQMEKDRQGA